VVPCCIACVLAACAAPPPAPEPGVRLDGDWIVYHSETTAEANLEARVLRDRHPSVRGLRISSNGGNIEHGLALGEWVLAAGLDVYVDGYCYSSCANYVFPAGRRKILAESAMVGWHGGTRQWENAEAMCREALDPAVTPAAEFEACLLRAEGLRQREARLFDLLGVDPSFTVRGFRDGANYPSAPTDVAWTYSLADMERLGLGPVAVDGRRWRPRSDRPDHTVCLLDLDSGRCGPL
ncbi:MAG: hypothetical protein P8008_04760, partial [Gammaproteobacteria bacterium]